MPLSFPQERLLLLDRLAPGLPAYNVPTLVRVGASLDGAALRQAFDVIVARHEILRTKLDLMDGAPVQQVLPHRPFELAVADLRAVPAQTRGAEAQRLLGEFARRPFDLSGDVLLRATLVHLDADEDLLLTVFHHVASDHASSALLFAELEAAYGALISGEQPDLPPLPIQYSDFAAWQRQQLRGPLVEELLDYWTDRLRDAPPRIDLPSDRARPSVQSYRGALREFDLPAALAAPLRHMARDKGVSLFVALQSAFKVLLARYTGAEDIVVGVPVSGRHHEEALPLLGCFTNTLPIRTDLSGDPTFTELLGRVKADTLEAQMYQELPFEKLVQVLNPERNQSYSPIFQVLLGFDVATSAAQALGGAAVELLPVPGWEWARFDLSLVLRELADGSLHAHVEYATDLFDPPRIERLIGHFQTLVAAIAHDPTVPISELPILTDAERRRLLVDWNRTEETRDPRCLHELISEQAARTPEAVAVVSAAGPCTYGELERRSNQLARELSATGVGADTLVGICVERGIDMMVALLATLKCGAAYVPVDPTFPPQRQELMLADSGAPVLLTQDRFVGTLDPGEAAVICLDRDWPRIAQHAAEPFAAPSSQDQLAYVIYTSGSTGRPKGVEISHRALVNFLASMRERPGMAEGDVLLAVTTLSFDIAGLELFLPLLVGARVVITPLEATMDGVELADWLARSRATFMQATPTTWQLLVDAGWKGSSSLKIACGGEALPRPLADQLLDRCTSLWQMYGPTETTIWSSTLELSRRDGPPPLGGPIANTSFYVLDSHRQPVPVGVPGELYIGGEGVAEGYHNRPELTRERFLANPFASGGGRVYRTGDLVRWREDGTLDFLGRIDQQVKLRGFRIELEEIEAVLASQDGVTTAVAAVREDVPGDRRLVAYVVPRHDDPLDVEKLRRAAKAKLPPYMVPSAYVVVQSLPATPNGKLDRNALPAPDGARPELERGYVAPAGPIEEALASIWREVLAIDRAGVEDDFFDLGGHSLLAVKMLALLEDTVGVTLPLRALFDSTTIRELAQAVSAELLGGAESDDLAQLLSEAEAAGS